MKKSITILLFALSFVSLAQKEKTENKKGKTLGERIGGVAGNLLTAKTDALDNVAVTINIISGIYDMRTQTTETKFFPEGSTEGDYGISVSFFKNGGVGLYKLKGEVLCDGEPMEYLGIGSYMRAYKQPFTEPRKIEIKTESGDQATIFVRPIPEIELVSLNNDKVLPIMDLSEDLTIEYANPPGAEESFVNAGLLTDILGTRTFNYFANFPAKKTTIKVPKESFSHLAYGGASQVNKGETFFALERNVKLEKSQLGPENQLGDLPAVTIFAKSYASMPVIVKGKQDEGIITQLSFGGRFNNDIGFEVHKPNAHTGIPFSRGSKFGLASLTVNGNLYKQETKSSSSSWTVGNTRYTQTTITTTTYEFPQLSNAHWDNMLETFYAKLVPVFKDNFSIPFEDVDKITASPNYKTTFPVDEVNTYSKISRTYRNTKRTSPRGLVEFFKTLSSSQSSETPINMLMKELGLDGVVSVELNLDIAANKEKNVVLIPTVNFSVKGMDETKGMRSGTYAEGTIRIGNGVPFNEAMVRADPYSLVKICRLDEIAACLNYMLKNLQVKEIAMGYDKVWSIGE
jgi:hypothetical protein